MKKLKHWAVALACVATMGTASGCGSSLSVPDKFCQVPVKRSALSPLVPEGDALAQKYSESQAQPGAACILSVDDHQVLSVNLLRWDHAPDPVNWKAVASPYKHAAKRDVSFPGGAVIGSDQAVVQANCDSPSAYMSFTFFFRGARVEESAGGYKKLQHFIDDFVPRETKKFDCTG
ncbi:hypothetical protein ACFVXE_14120 [Streptomyces sp. NPDC058231]|uniref:hypothetical protein n=1 Tax=Streptomyces sp. NPDC058231 TaxID=3346392 RepID=UPI0036EA756D